MVAIERRERGKRQRRQTFRSIFFIGFFLILLVTGATAFFHLPIWRIEHVEFSGLHVIPEEKMAELVPSIPGEHIFIVNLRKVEEVIGNFPPVRRAHARRVFPNKIVVDIQERTAEAILLFPEGSLLVDPDGVLLTKRFPISWYEGVDIQKLPVIRGIPQTAIQEDTLIPKYAKAFQTIFPPFRKAISAHNFQIDLGILDHVTIWVEDLVQVRLGSMEQLEEKMELFENIWKALGERWPRVEYIDLEFLKQPIIKFKG